MKTLTCGTTRITLTGTTVIFSSASHARSFPLGHLSISMESVNATYYCLSVNGIRVSSSSTRDKVEAAFTFIVTAMESINVPPTLV